MRTPETTQWSCHSCTACCRGFQFGPVEEEVIQGLTAHTPESWWEPAASTPWFQARSGPDGAPHYYLTAIDGHCIFLRDDGLCAVHAKLGEAAKPGFCREFPHHIIEEKDDYVGVIRAECEGWYKSYQSGEPIESTLEAIRALPRVVPRRHFAPKQVMLFPTTAISYEHYQHLENELCRCLEEQNRGIEGDLRELRTVIRTLAGMADEASDMAAYRQNAAQVLAPLVHMLNAILQMPHADPYQVQFTRASRERLQHTLVFLESGTSLPRSQHFDEYFNLVLRNDILGKRFQSVGSLTAGLGLFALGTLVARCSSEDGDLSHAAAHYAGWLRFSAIPAVQQSLTTHRVRLSTLFFHVAPFA